MNATFWRSAVKKGKDGVDTLLRVTNLSKAFAGVQALKSVSFDLQAGEVHALVGENGAGKTTLIKIITGAHAADEGTLEIGGKEIQQHDPSSARSASRPSW